VYAAGNADCATAGLAAVPDKVSALSISFSSSYLDAGTAAVLMATLPVREPCSGCTLASLNRLQWIALTVKMLFIIHRLGVKLITPALAVLLGCNVSHHSALANESARRHHVT